MCFHLFVHAFTFLLKGKTKMHCQNSNVPIFLLRLPESESCVEVAILLRVSGFCMLLLGFVKPTAINQYNKNARVTIHCDPQ